MKTIVKKVSYPYIESTSKIAGGSPIIKADVHLMLFRINNCCGGI